MQKSIAGENSAISSQPQLANLMIWTRTGEGHWQQAETALATPAGQTKAHPLFQRWKGTLQAAWRCLLMLCVCPQLAKQTWNPWILGVIRCQ